MWKIERQGNLIVVNVLQGDKYIPLLIFTSLVQFHRWAMDIGEQVKNITQLCDQIEGVYRGVFKEPEGAIWDYVKDLKEIDAVGKNI